MNRDDRQQRVHTWAKAAFGVAHATSLPQRGLRLLEEAVELFQAAGGDQDMAHKLVSFVFSRPAGTIEQELGGVGVAVLALAAAFDVSADDMEQREVDRVLSKPLEFFAARNAEKNAAGFAYTGEAAATVDSVSELVTIADRSGLANLLRRANNRRPSLAQRRAALGLSSPSASERRENLAETLDDLTGGATVTADAALDALNRRWRARVADDRTVARVRELESQLAHMTKLHRLSERAMNSAVDSSKAFEALSMKYFDAKEPLERIADAAHDLMRLVSMDVPEDVLKWIRDDIGYNAIAYRVSALRDALANRKVDAEAEAFLAQMCSDLGPTHNED